MAYDCEFVLCQRALEETALLFNPQFQSFKFLLGHALQSHRCGKCKAGTCFILLPCATLRRSFSPSGSAPTFKNTSYASEMGRVFSIRPCLTRMQNRDPFMTPCIFAQSSCP